MKDGRPVVLVTGAAGFVGRHLAPALSKEGWLVRRAVRHRTGEDDEVVIPSIGSATSWQAALEGVDAVVHLAARVHHRVDAREAELYRTINVDGAAQLAQSAASAGIRHFVFVSTVLVHGRSNDGRAPFTENDVLVSRGLYSESKVKAETALKSIAQKSNMLVTVLRPPLIYGAGAKGNFALLVRAVKLGVPLPFGAIQNNRAFLSVENLVSFISHRLSRAEGKFEIFLIADGEHVSTPEFVKRLAAAAGKKARLFSMPASALGVLLKLAGRVEMRDGLIGSLRLDLSKAASTGWKPPITLNEGLRRALSSTYEAEIDDPLRDLNGACERIYMSAQPNLEVTSPLHQRLSSARRVRRAIASPRR